MKRNLKKLVEQNRGQPKNRQDSIPEDTASFLFSSQSQSQSHSFPFPTTMSIRIRLYYRQQPFSIPSIKCGPIPHIPDQWSSIRIRIRDRIPLSNARCFLWGLANSLSPVSVLVLPYAMPPFYCIVDPCQARMQMEGRPASSTSNLIASASCQAMLQHHPPSFFPETPCKLSCRRVIVFPSRSDFRSASSPSHSHLQAAEEEDECRQKCQEEYEYEYECHSMEYTTHTHSHCFPGNELQDCRDTPIVLVHGFPAYNNMGNYTFQSAGLSRAQECE